MVSSQSSVSTLKGISFFKEILLKKRNFKDKKKIKGDFKKSKEIYGNFIKSRRIFLKVQIFVLFWNFPSSMPQVHI